MNWNFDEAIDRKGTSCLKHDLAGNVFGKKDILPLWVADMDFRAPDFIIDNLRKRVEHGIFGYTYRNDVYHQSIIDWMKRRHKWDIDKKWICFCPGIVPAISFCINAFTDPGDSIIVQTPVYPPIFTSVTKNRRKLVCNQLVEKNHRWYMDFESLSGAITRKTKMLILCNPHNPVGRSWEQAELKQIADICIANNILIISDDIHCDLLLPGKNHTPIASMDSGIADLSITCIAPSKTFNVAGLATSAVIIPNQNLREKFETITNNYHITDGNLFGTIASIEAYSHGDEWLDALMKYIGENETFVREYCANNIPQIIPTRLEATFLMWLDCRSLGLNANELPRFFANSAGVGLNDGSTFGKGGEGFMRINIGTQRSVLKKAMKQIEKAVVLL